MNYLEKKDSVSLDTPLEELETKLLTENDIDELNKIINVFNLNIKRKDMVRTSKLNDLQDRITNQMSERLNSHAGEFSNKDLLDYFKVVQDTIDKSDNSLKDIDTPSIQINQQQINIGTDNSELNRESRERVKDFISKILGDAKDADLSTVFNQENVIDADVLEEVEKGPTPDEQNTTKEG